MGKTVTMRNAYSKNAARAFLRRSRAATLGETANRRRAAQACSAVLFMSIHLDLRFGHHLPETEHAAVDDGRQRAQHHQHDGERGSVAELVVGEITAEGLVVGVERPDGGGKKRPALRENENVLVRR